MASVNRFNEETLQLLQNMSTSMFNALSPSVGASELICRKLEASRDQQLTEHFSMLQKSQFRLLNTAENMNVYSNIELGEQIMHKSVIDMNEMAEELVQTAHMLNVKTKLSFIPVEEECLVKGDGELLERLILNVVSNSCIHGTHCTLELRIDHENHSCVICVRDNGAGIRSGQNPFAVPHTLEELMQPGRGAGLGLRTADSIARLHSGTLFVSAAEKGAEVLIRLPLAKPEDVGIYGIGYCMKLRNVVAALSDVVPRDSFSQPYL